MLCPRHIGRYELEVVVGGGGPATEPELTGRADLPSVWNPLALVTHTRSGGRTLLRLGGPAEP